MDVLEILNRARAERGLPPARTPMDPAIVPAWTRIFQVTDFDRSLTVYRCEDILRYTETIQGHTKSTFSSFLDPKSMRYPTVAELRRNNR